MKDLAKQFAKYVFDHKIFGLTPSFTSILQLIHRGGGRAGGEIILNMDT